MLTLTFGFSHAGLAQENPPVHSESETLPAVDSTGIEPDQQSVKAAQSMAAPTDPQEDRRPVKVPGKKVLPLRVMARPFSNIYKEPNETSAIIEENVPVFDTYYVYTRPDVKVTEIQTEGWYEVGKDNRGNIKGWMKADDVMEWKQTMCLAYQHPNDRKPVLMFSDVKSLRDLVKAAPAERTKNAESYYQQIEAYRKDKSKKLRNDFPIISVEPNGAVDIEKNFYLLPILEHAPVEIGGQEARMLKIASAPKEGRRPSTDNPLDEPNPLEGTESEGDVLKKLEMDIVYVMDMTNSMHPFIESTLTAINDTAKLITQDQQVAESVRFGIWGYRDSPDIPEIGFHTNNFTKTLQKIGEFEQTLSGIEQAQKSFTTDSRNYPEDVFSGIDKAMRETQWTPNAMRIIVLMGDAPSHPLGHEWNYSGQSADTLRTYANDNKYTIISLHIKAPRREDYWDQTMEQFQTLAKNRGVGDHATYYGVPGDDMNAFHEASKGIADYLVEIMDNAKKGQMTVVEKDKQSGEPKKDLRSLVITAGNAALVDWLGKMMDKQAPRDIVAWVTDRDLIDPMMPSLDVRVLITKNELDSLRTTLQQVMTAGRMSTISGDKFFDTLQMIPAVMTRAKDQVRNAKNLASTGLLPEFMDDLPYQSQIMSISNDLWASWSMDQQDQFLNEIDAKIQQYNAIHDTPDGWVALNKGDDPGNYVYPISLVGSLP